MKESKFLNSKLLYKIIALFFALLLFFYVNSSQLGNIRSQQNDPGLMSTKSVILNVPLKMNINTDKYFVSGYPEEVAIRLSGPSAMVIATENTRNFEVYADLSQLGVGSHTVKLKVAGLNNELTANIQPATIHVNISRRRNAVLPVQVRFDSGQIAKGYAPGNATSSQQTVEVTGSAKNISRIDSIVADVELPHNLTKSYTRSVMLKAIDANGHLVDVNINPMTVKVTVPIYEATNSKKVPVNLVTSGKGLKDKIYHLSSNTKTVTIRGTKKALAHLDKLDVPVPIMGVVDSQTKTIQITPAINGITGVNPNQIQVDINVADVENHSSAKSASSTSLASYSTSHSTHHSSAKSFASSSISEASSSEASTHSSTEKESESHSKHHSHEASATQTKAEAKSSE